MNKNKAKQRTELSELRDKLSSEDIHKFSQRISDRAYEIIKKRQVKDVHVYLPIEAKKEPDTWQLIKRLQSEGLEVYTSIFSADRALKHVKLQPDTVFDYDVYGIPRPTANYEQIATDYDVIVVPLLGFDDRLNRLGYGMGVYDAFLYQQPKAYKIGLGYEVSKIKRIKNEKHDITLDIIITEEKLYN